MGSIMSEYTVQKIFQKYGDDYVTKHNKDQEFIDFIKAVVEK